MLLMMINKDLLKIEKENVFSKATLKIADYKKDNPNKKLISLGIGDVSIPIIRPVLEAMHKAIEEQGDINTFNGYGAYYGLKELREAISINDYNGLISPDEIYVGDGTKSDSTNILELFDKDIKVLVGNPTYPIYLNGALALSRKAYFANMSNDFKMLIPKEKYDVVYICSPSNPIGNAYTKEDLKLWIDYADKNNSIIIYDNVYKDFVSNPDVPKTIYEIDGAKKCVIELRSFSKNASFSGIRVSYLVLPKEMGSEISSLWKERTINRFNGACVIAQKGALATYSDKAKEMIKENIKTYKENTKYLKDNFIKLGYEVIGGNDAPYMFVKCKDKMSSWQTFDFFLKELNIIVIPGVIFGSNGEGYFRVSGLGLLKDSKEAVLRMKEYEKTH